MTQGDQETEKYRAVQTVSSLHSLCRAVSKQIETKNIKLYLINLISIGTLEDSTLSWGEGEGDKSCRVKNKTHPLGQDL